LILCLAGLTSSLIYAQQQTAPAAAPAPAAAAAAPAGGTMTPVQRADSAPQGTLKNPYPDTNADAVAAGGNVQAYIHSIAKSGYATDPEYGNKLNQIVNSGPLQAALLPRTAAL